MKRACPFCLALIVACLLSACQTRPSATSVPEGLKIGDLKDTTQDLEKADFLITFRVFQYQIDPNSVDRLVEVHDVLSRSPIHFKNEAAFYANGFAARSGTRDQASEVARALSDAGATRSGFALLSVPPSETNILSSISVNQPLTLSFASDADKTGTQLLYPGYLGWTLFAESSALRNTVIVKLAPAYWQQGGETIRILTGKEPIAFNLFEFAAFQTRMRQGDFLVLTPKKLSSDDTSLNRALFLHYGRRPRALCFVIFCESAGL